MSKAKITVEQPQRELDAGTPIPAIAVKYSLTPKGVRNHITRLHKKDREKPARKSYGQQQAEKLKEENTGLRTGNLLWIPTKVTLPPETPEGTPDEDCPEYIVTIAGATNSAVLKYSPDGTWFDDNGFVYKVTAWRYMPEVYDEQ